MDSELSDIELSNSRPSSIEDEDLYQEEEEEYQDAMDEDDEYNDDGADDDDEEYLEGREAEIKKPKIATKQTIRPPVKKSERISSKRTVATGLQRVRPKRAVTDKEVNYSEESTSVDKAIEAAEAADEKEQELDQDAVNVDVDVEEEDDEEIRSPAKKRQRTVLEDEEDAQTSTANNSGSEQLPEEDEEEDNGGISDSLRSDFSIGNGGENGIQEDFDAEDNMSTPAGDEDNEEVEARENTEDASIIPSNLLPKNKMLISILDDNPFKKKLTEEEIQLRRAENARKRKNLSEKRLEEEKRETLNKLLKKRAGKSRSKVDKDEPENTASTIKPRRPYNSNGMVRIIRKRDEDLYCIF